MHGRSIDLWTAPLIIRGTIFSSFHLVLGEGCALEFLLERRS
ncbi:unnamed protein product [Linum tenue]|uniref:Uncharacterized protein n=1 Tax=Linum tenue TaxID=586396 RepID=A0AAV0GRA5_9ROSI|nr:unnamed protein product [Linum tenue]